MREQLLARVQPAIDELAEQLVSMLLKKVDGLVEQMRGAFDAALSSFASDLNDDEATPAPPDLYRGRVERTVEIVGLDSFVPNTTKAKPKKVLAEKTTRTNTCRKCGARGFTARTCGKTHNVTTSPAEEEESDEASTTPARPSGKTTRTPATSPIQAPPLNALSIGSLLSRRPPRSAATARKDVPRADELPGWSPEEDRREEWKALGELNLNRKP